MVNISKREKRAKKREKSVDKGVCVWYSNKAVAEASASAETRQ